MRLTLLAPPRHRDFRLLFIGQTVSMVTFVYWATALAVLRPSRAGGEQNSR